MRNKRSLGAAAALLLMSLLSLLVLTGCGRQHIDLKDYVKVTFSSADGYGKASATLDETALLDQLQLDEEDMDLESIGNALNAVWYVEDIQVSLDTDEHLSNGDKVTVTVTYPEELSQALHASVSPKSGASWTVKVSDLPQVEQRNPFDTLDVTFSGYDGYGQAELSDGSDYGLNYTPTKTQGLSNGDTITLTVSAPGDQDLEEYCIDRYGFVPTATSQDYTVSGLEAVDRVDLFEGLEVTVEGTSPRLSLSFFSPYQDQGISYLLEDPDQNGQLEAGDTVTIQAVAQGLLSNYDLNGYCLEHLEAPPASDTWTYTIGQDVPCYITESEQLSGAPLDALIAEAQDQFLASAAKNPNLTVNSANYYGYYLLTAKRYSGWQDYNRVFVVLEVNYTLDGETNTHYNPVEFDDVLIGTDGACHYDQVSNLYGWFWEDGADSIYDFETDHITPELADYHEFSGQ